MQNETEVPPEEPSDPGLKTPDELTEEVMAEVVDTDEPQPEPAPEPEPVTHATKNSSTITIASGSGRIRMPRAAYQAIQEAKNGPT